MNNINIKPSKRVLVTLVFLFLCFILIISKAFEYLPNENDNNISETENTSIQKTNINKKIISEENAAETEEIIKQEVIKKRELNIKLQNPDEEISKIEPMEKLETIDIREEEFKPAAVQNKTLSAQEETELKFYQAQKLRSEKQYTKALEEYNSIVNSTTDKNISARCYEEMSNIYGILKRYGTAMSYAQKAYNIAPTSSREMLIARLYYKTGDIDKATKRINNILQRDFSLDNN